MKVIIKKEEFSIKRDNGLSCPFCENKLSLLIDKEKNLKILNEYSHHALRICCKCEKFYVAECTIPLNLKEVNNNRFEIKRR